MSEVTRILADIESGDPIAAERLLPLVYEELRKLAAQRQYDVAMRVVEEGSPEHPAICGFDDIPYTWSETQALAREAAELMQLPFPRQPSPGTLNGPEAALPERDGQEIVGESG